MGFNPALIRLTLQHIITDNLDAISESDKLYLNELSKEKYLVAKVALFLLKIRKMPFSLPFGVIGSLVFKNRINRFRKVHCRYDEKGWGLPLTSAFSISEDTPD